MFPMNLKVTSNFSTQFSSWGVIKRGTLEVKPEYKDKGLEDILEDAGLNFPVTKNQLYYYDPIASIFKPSRSYNITKGDFTQELGYGMTSRYAEMSYPDILSGYFGDFKNLGGIPTRAISIDNGSKAAIQFIFEQAMWKIADREHGLFFNFYASQDGKTPILLNTSDICIVCGNTYAMSKADNRLRTSIRHTKNASSRLAELKGAFHNFEEPVNEYYFQLSQFPRFAADNRVNNQSVQEAFISAMFPKKESENGEIVAQNKSRENQMENLRVAIGNSAAERNTSDITIYDLFQGLTRYTSYRTQNRNTEEQFAYVTEGPGAELSSKGFNWLVDYASENQPEFQISLPA
jgi:hypothetical protein